MREYAEYDLYLPLGVYRIQELGSEGGYLGLRLPTWIQARNSGSQP